MGTKEILKQMADIPPAEGRLTQRVRVHAYTLGGKYLATYPSYAEASRDLKVWESSIHFCIHGKQKTAGGYQFRRAEENKAKKDVK